MRIVQWSQSLLSIERCSFILKTDYQRLTLFWMYWVNTIDRLRTIRSEIFDRNQLNSISYCRTTTNFISTKNQKFLFYRWWKFNYDCTLYNEQINHQTDQFCNILYARDADPSSTFMKGIYWKSMKLNETSVNQSKQIQTVVNRTFADVPIKRTTVQCSIMCTFQCNCSQFI